MPRSITKVIRAFKWWNATHPEKNESLIVLSVPTDHPSKWLRCSCVWYQVCAHKLWGISRHSSRKEIFVVCMSPPYKVDRKISSFQESGENCGEHNSYPHFFVNCSVKYLSEKKKIIIIFAVLRLFSGVQYYSALLTEIMITAPYFCIFTTSPSIWISAICCFYKKSLVASPLSVKVIQSAPIENTN